MCISTKLIEPNCSVCYRLCRCHNLVSIICIVQYTIMKMHLGTLRNVSYILHHITFALVTGYCFSLKKPTIIPHHIGIIVSTNFLVKFFTIFFAYRPLFIWKEEQV